ncbi:MAG: hypothetical protein FJX25_16870, partial [Alphaproteobacteria bacterium]|nr:hypothetical protein [Alphaproteobacteria bacterium]
APWRAVEMGTNETIKQAVIAGLGIALISQHTCTEELRAGRLVRCRPSACRSSAVGTCCTVRTARQVPRPSASAPASPPWAAAFFLASPRIARVLGQPRAGCGHGPRPDQADWRPLRGRDLVWPRNHLAQASTVATGDPEGRHAGHALCMTLCRLRSVKVRQEYLIRRASAFFQKGCCCRLVTHQGLTEVLAEPRDHASVHAATILGLPHGSPLHTRGRAGAVGSTGAHSPVACTLHDKVQECMRQVCSPMLAARGTSIFSDRSPTITSGREQTFRTPAPGYSRWRRRRDTVRQRSRTSLFSGLREDRVPQGEVQERRAAHDMQALDRRLCDRYGGISA